MINTTQQSIVFGFVFTERGVEWFINISITIWMRELLRSGCFMYSILCTCITIQNVTIVLHTKTNDIF